jgi:histidinol dehydrogenase
MRRLDREEFLRWARERRERSLPQEALQTAAAIIARVREEGDRALCELTLRYDRVRLSPEEMRVSPEEVEEGVRACPPDLLESLRTMKERIESFHRLQIPAGAQWADGQGNILGWIWQPLRRVGIYVPGGKAAYPSSLLMGAIPARLAGVEKVYVFTPPGEGGRIPSPVLAAAALCGVDGVFRVGGAQAVAAMAFGTETVPRVEKVVGPGNIYVTAAKKLVMGVVGIDGLYGPSEICVVADSSARPSWVAADCLAQAEHGPDSAVALLSPDEELLREVEDRLARHGGEGLRAIEEGVNCPVSSIEEALELAEEMAPEHLHLHLSDPWPYLPLVRAAGAVFLGAHSPVAAGDYGAGTNHVLPTGGTARFSSGLSVRDFMRSFHYLYSSPAGVRAWLEPSRRVAEAEGLERHARSLTLRGKGGDEG